MDFHALSGMRDYIGDSAEDLHHLFLVAQRLFQSAGFREISTPLMEDGRLFDRSLGSASDVVSKEMYTIEQGGDRIIALRPENTAGVVRSVIENDLMANRNQLKTYYTGPMFRHERPQSGRLRQFHQLGVEVFGREDALCDAEVIQLGDILLDRLELSDFTLLLNTIGDPPDRRAFEQALRNALSPYEEDLPEDDRRRLTENPLRVLDSKQDFTNRLVEEHAPDLHDFLGEGAREHFDTVREYLETMGIEYRVDPELVRGLDYYRRTTFEFVTGELGSQDAVLAGGRYDGLSEQLGGDPCPAMGFAAGAERIMLLRGTYDQNDVDTHADLFLIPFNQQCLKQLIPLASHLRNQTVGRQFLRVELGSPKNSLRSLMRRANRYDAKLVLMLGDDELNAGTVAVKNMKSGEQEPIEFTDIETVTQQLVTRVENLSESL